MSKDKLAGEIEKVLDEFGSKVVKYCALDIDKNRFPVVKPQYTKEEIIIGQGKLISQALVRILELVKKCVPEKKTIQEIIKYKNYNPETHIYKRGFTFTRRQ
mgnify:CR=1 FL=1